MIRTQKDKICVDTTSDRLSLYGNKFLISLRRCPFILWVAAAFEVKNKKIIQLTGGCYDIRKHIEY